MADLSTDIDTGTDPGSVKVWPSSTEEDTDGGVFLVMAATLGGSSLMRVCRASDLWNYSLDSAGSDSAFYRVSGIEGELREAGRIQEWLGKLGTGLDELDEDIQALAAATAASRTVTLTPFDADGLADTAIGSLTVTKKTGTNSLEFTVTAAFTDSDAQSLFTSGWAVCTDGSSPEQLLRVVTAGDIDNGLADTEQLASSISFRVGRAEEELADELIGCLAADLLLTYTVKQAEA